MVRIFQVLFVFMVGIYLNHNAFAQAADPAGWTRMAGTAVDISINTDGQAYVVAPSGTPWRWDKVEQRWRRMSGSFQRITAAEGNRPWAINVAGVVFRYNGLWWEDKDTDVVDVAADTKGNVYIVNANGQIKKWYALRSEWRPIQSPTDGIATRIVVDGAGQPWVVLRDGSIRSFDGKDWMALPGRARDIALGGLDMVAVADADGQVRTWDSTQKRWTVVDGVGEASGLGITPDGKLWVIGKDGVIVSNGGLVSEEKTLNEPKASVPKPALVEAPIEVASVPTPPVNTATTPTANTAQAKGSTTSKTSSGSSTASDAGAPATITTKDKITFINTLKSASTLAIGADGSVFALDGGGRVLRWSNKKKKFDTFPGTLVRIAVDKDGHPWGISALGRVFRHTGTRWKQIPNATASDISIGYDGTVLTASSAGRLYKINDEQTAFTLIPGTGVTLVAAGPDGTPWAVRTDKLVQRCDVSPCKVYPQKANAIAVGPDGSVWIVSNTNRLMRLTKNDKFEIIKTPGHTPQKVAVGPMGYPWVVSSASLALASIYFDRDEGADQSESSSTASSGTTGTGTTASVASTSVSGFTFSKSMSFETVSFTNLAGGSCPIFASDMDGIMWAHNSGGDLEKYSTIKKKFAKESTGFDGWDLSEFAVAPNGDVWAATLNPQTGLFRERNGTRKQYTISGSTNFEDVSVGPDGTVYVSIAFSGGVRYLYAKAENSQVFKKFSTYNNVRRVDVGPGGDIWISDANIKARRWNGSAFEKPANVSFSASDIAVSKVDGTVYANENGTAALYKWNASNESFDKVNNTTFSKLGVDGDGRPWICRDTTPVIERGRD